MRIDLIIYITKFSKQDEINTAEIVFTVLTYIMLIAQIYHESIQVRHKGVVSYFKDYWNLFDVVSISTLFIYFTIRISRSDDGETKDTVKESQPGMYLLLVGSLASFIRFISWLRVYKKTRYLIRLIVECIIDMIWFTIILTLMMIFFALANWVFPNKEESKRHLVHDFSLNVNEAIGEF